MRPKIFRAFFGEPMRRTPRYLKDETRSIGRREIVSGGNWLKREGDLREKNMPHSQAPAKEENVISIEDGLG